MLIPDGELRAYLDGEVEPARRAEIERALAGDPALARRLEVLRQSSLWAAESLAALDEPHGSVDADAALAALPLGRKPATRNLPAWGALAASLLLGALLLGWQPARAAAQRLLGLLRFESVAVLEINRGLLPSNLSESQMELFAQALSDSVERVKEPGQPQTAESREEASALAHIPVRLPAGVIRSPALTVEGSQTLEMTVDIVRIERMIDIIGGSDVEIPEKLDQAHVRVDLYEVVRARYGDCWKEGASGPDPSCFQLLQSRTPSVVTTPALDLAEVARLGLEVAGMSPEEAAMMTAAINWTSTLVIPLQEGKAQHREVEVDGVRGVLMLFPSESGKLQRYGLFWVKNGLTYRLFGSGDAGFGLQMANSLE